MFYSRFESQCKMCKKSPTAVCVELGFSNATASHWKNGHLPKADILITIADYFDCSVDYLLGRTNEIKMNTGKSVDVDVNIGDNSANFNFGFSADDIALLQIIHRFDIVERSRIICELSERLNVEK